jgi:hypothetical protein
MISRFRPSAMVRRPGQCGVSGSEGDELRGHFGYSQSFRH